MSVTAGVHPETHKPVAFLVVHDDDGDDVAVVLGDREDITTLLTTLIRTQNMMEEAERLHEERGASTAEEALAILGEVVNRYSISE